MHLLPSTRRAGFQSLFKKYFYWIKNRTRCSANTCLADNCKSDKHNGYLHCRVPFLFHLSSNIHTCTKQKGDHDTENNIAISTKNIEIEEHSEVFRNSLYPNSVDPIIIQLKLCDSVSSAVKIINDNSHFLTSMHYCQAILVIWDLTKNGKELYSHLILKSDRPSHTNIESGRFCNKVNDSYIHPTILKALDHLSTDSESLTSEEVVYSVLYANRLGIDLKNSSIQTLLQKISELLSKEDCKVLPLSLLSRLSIIFVDHDELWTKLFLIKTIPFIYKFFDQCSNADDFKALTICMLSTLPYLKEDLLVEYEALTDELLRNGSLTKDQNSSIVKAVWLLSYIYHKPSARLMTYRLLQMLSGQVDQLFFPHLLNLHRILLLNLEPQSTIMELENVKKIKSSQILSLVHYPPSFFIISVPSNDHGSLILKNLINQQDTLEGLLCLYYLLTTVHLEACNMFWEKVSQLMGSVDSGMLQWICLRYMMFMYRMGLYRNKSFEAHILSLITSELVTGSAAHRPNQFSFLASFVLSYESNERGSTSLSLSIIPRLISMAGQFDAHSCFMLSRGFKQAMYNIRKRESLELYLQLDSALNIRIRELLDSANNLSLTTFNTLLRSCINKKGSSESDLLWDIIKRCEHLDWSQLTSRSLRNLVYNLLSTSSLVSVAIDEMVKYCLENRLSVTCETVGKLAYLCYVFGYSPISNRSFCALTADLVARDYKNQKGLTLLHVALALSFFNYLPLSLNRIIFSVDFLERLDEEIKNCFAKDRYPMRIRWTLMQLNRSVCLDNPEADVPWFHSKYCEEQQALGKSDIKPKTLLFMDVFNTLSGLVGGSTYIGQNVITPYGYTVDIQLNLDAASNPVPLKESAKAAHKLAVLLYYGDSFTVNERRLKGYHQMKQRHLEILGYKVIGLSDTLWNAMWMTEPPAKQEYLQNIIWPSCQVN